MVHRSAYLGVDTEDEDLAKCDLCAKPPSSFFIVIILKSCSVVAEENYWTYA
jgi:hypothetical protein